MKRCVVSSPNALYKDAGGMVSPLGLGITDLNYYSLYWDELVIPTHRMFQIVLPNEEEYISLGVLKRPVFGDGNFDSDTFVDEYNENKRRVLYEKQKKHPYEDWFMHGIGDEESAQITTSLNETTFRTTIFNVLPVPSFEIPLAEILEFKERNKDDLNKLHEHLDEVYTHVVTTPDIPLLKAKAFESFNNALQDINRLSELAWDAPFWKRYSLSFNIPTASENIESLLSIGAAAVAGDKVSTSIEITKSIIGMISLEDAHASFIHGPGLKKDLSFLASGYREKIF
ncbi:hypothetical protein EN46_02105 [Citrobacter amalonaticus]